MSQLSHAQLLPDFAARSLSREVKSHIGMSSFAAKMGPQKARYTPQTPEGSPSPREVGYRHIAYQKKKALYE